MPSGSASLPALAIPSVWASNSTVAAVTPSALKLWWEQLHDAQLNQLVTQALARNTDVRSARAALQQARALRDAQASTLLPQLGANAFAQRSRNGAASANSFALGLDASWEPDIFAGNHAALNAAQADAQAAASTLGQVQLSLVAEVAATYVGLRSLQARLDITRRSLVTQADSLQLARWRTQAGLSSSLDVEQALASYEQTRAQLPVLERSLAQTFHTLAVLTGQAPGPLQNSLIDAPVPLVADELAIALPAATLRQRADVRAAEQRLQAAWQRLAQADAQRYPQFQISGSLGLRALALSALDNGASVVNSLLTSVSVPLFDGGAARARVRVQDAVLEQARVNYEATVLSALQDVENALVSLQNNRERGQRLVAAQTAATSAEQLARQRYASGLIDFRTVLDSQRTLLAVQDALASTQADLSIDHIRLYQALGGGWVTDDRHSPSSPRGNAYPTPLP